VFDAFMPVFCVLTMEICKGVILCYELILVTVSLVLIMGGW
jgi:hypothetical protein